jgi:hypothetical protein
MQHPIFESPNLLPMPNIEEWMIPARDEILIQTRRTKSITIAGKSIFK